MTSKATRTRAKEDGRIAEAFIRGWHDGALGVGADCARAAHDAYPDYSAEEVSVYLNGVGDGARGDRYRLDGSLRDPVEHG